MNRSGVLLLALIFLSGCETLNEAVVRQMFRDGTLSRRVGNQIREGLERRRITPAQPTLQPAPAFLDQG